MATIEDHFTYSNGNLATVSGGVWAENTTGYHYITSNQCNNQVVETIAVAWHTTALGVSQYIKVKLPTVDNTVIMFRFTDMLSPYYGIYVDDSDNYCSWFSAPTPSEDGLDVDYDDASPIAAGDILGITIIGTGASTIVRVWRNPTANAPDAGGLTWDSASPLNTFSGTPDYLANSGSYVGVKSWGVKDRCQYDDFYAGDIPVPTDATPVLIFPGMDGGFNERMSGGLNG